MAQRKQHLKTTSSNREATCIDSDHDSIELRIKSNH